MVIIPAIDIIGGKCVRLEKGEYSSKKEYADDPLQVAREFEKAGIKHLHLVDLDGAKASHVINDQVLSNITKNTKLRIDFGGGVKSDEDLQKVFDAGAKQVTGGSIAVKNPELFHSWITQQGPEKIILGADVMDEQIRVSGWQEGSGLMLFDFLSDYISKGIQYVICTDISKDGMLGGPAFELYQKILTQFPSLKLIASGGVSSKDDLTKLKKLGLYGAIVGKAYYEGKISIEELASFN